MRRVLIAGGSGQIGRALIASAPPDSETSAPGSRHLDIRDESSVSRAFADVRPDLVINAAAYTAVDKAEAEREMAFATNADGAGNLARACRATRTALMHLSTDYVFDGSKAGEYTEDDLPNPLSVYGASKLAGEHQIQHAQIPHVILRVSWVFSSTGSNFVTTMLGLASREVLRVVNDQHGTPCAADDIAQALWMCGRRLETMDTRAVLHFSSKPRATWFDFATTAFDLARELGVVARIPQIEPISTSEYPTAARRPVNSLLDASRLEDFLGFQRPDWRVSLRDVMTKIERTSRESGSST